MTQFFKKPILQDVFFFLPFSFKVWDYIKQIVWHHLEIWVSSTHLKEWYLKPSLEQLGFHWDSAFPTAGNHWLLSLHHSSAQNRGSEHQFDPSSSEQPPGLYTQGLTPSRAHSLNPQASKPSLPQAAPILTAHLQQTQTFPTSMDKAWNLDCCALPLTIKLDPPVKSLVAQDLVLS